MSDRTLGIVGVGLIGGSIGMAARRAGWEVVGVDSAATLERALALGAIDRPADLDGVRDAEMVVLAAPVSQITGLLAELAPTDALVTDVGSAKAAIVRGAAAAGIRRFVGGHPMAGSQLGGVANASADLFQGARYLLTPTGDTLPEAYARVTQFVRDDLGAVPTAVDPERHDRLVAALSHLPHLLAVALLRVTSEISPDALSFAGPSFRDLTRVGAANPSLWADILAENAAAVREVLDLLHRRDAAARSRHRRPSRHRAALQRRGRRLRGPGRHPHRAAPDATSTSRCRSRTALGCSPRSPP